MQHSAGTAFRGVSPGNARKRHEFARSTILVSLACFTSIVFSADGSRETDQRQLDATCEKAREARIAPLREKKIQDCVESGEHSSREACEAEYSHFGQRAGKRPAMFYDIPECVKAFEFRKSYRRAD